MKIVIMLIVALMLSIQVTGCIDKETKANLKEALELAIEVEKAEAIAEAKAKHCPTINEVYTTYCEGITEKAAQHKICGRIQAKRERYCL